MVPATSVAGERYDAQAMRALHSERSARYGVRTT